MDKKTKKTIESLNKKLFDNINYTPEQVQWLYEGINTNLRALHMPDDLMRPEEKKEKIKDEKTVKKIRELINNEKK